MNVTDNTKPWRPCAREFAATHPAQSEARWRGGSWRGVKP